MTADALRDEDLTQTWQLSYAARLGSSVRSKGIYLEVRSLLPKAAQKALSVKAGELKLCMPAGEGAAFSTASWIVGKALLDIAGRPVIPREIEDILGISTTERRRWLADGRLPSDGTRTMKLRGRSTITFHVFDPAVVREILESDVIDAWREADAEKAAENRRRASWKRQLSRTKTALDLRSTPAPKPDDEDGVGLLGWAQFEREGPLRKASEPRGMDSRSSLRRQRFQS